MSKDLNLSASQKKMFTPSDLFREQNELISSLGNIKTARELNNALKLAEKSKIYRDIKKAGMKNSSRPLNANSSAII